MAVTLVARVVESGCASLVLHPTPRGLVRFLVASVGFVRHDFGDPDADVVPPALELRSSLGIVLADAAYPSTSGHSGEQRCPTMNRPTRILSSKPCAGRAMTV